MFANEMPDVLYRHSAPTRLDIAPVGTLCKVTVDKDRVDIYIQTSTDEENPRWELQQENVSLFS